MCASYLSARVTRVLLRARLSDAVRNRVLSSLSRACVGAFFAAVQTRGHLIMLPCTRATRASSMMLPQRGCYAHPDAVRKVEPPAARDTFTCCTALWLLWCYRRLQHHCGFIVAASLRCVFSSISAVERATACCSNGTCEPCQELRYTCSYSTQYSSLFSCAQLYTA